MGATGRGDSGALGKICSSALGDSAALDGPLGVPRRPVRRSLGEGGSLDEVGRSDPAASQDDLLFRAPTQDARYCINTTIDRGCTMKVEPMI
jgi:hypothetical protein